MISSRSQVNYSKGNHYPSPSDYPEVVAGDRLTPITPAQEKLAYRVVMMAGSSLKSAKK
jgi:hypothetical protein